MQVVWSSSTPLGTLRSSIILYVKVKVKFSHTCYWALGPELIPVYRQSARWWHEVNHAIDPAVGCRYFLRGLWLPPYLSPDGNTCKWQHTSDSSLTTHLSTQKGWKAELTSWLTCRGWFTHISGHPSAAGRAQDRESLPVRDRRSTTVLCHQPILYVYGNLCSGRMLRSAERSALPQFDASEFLSCMKKLVSVDRDWVPSSTSSTLYMRPTMIGTEPQLGVTQSRSALLYIITSPVGLCQFSCDRFVLVRVFLNSYSYSF